MEIFIRPIQSRDAESLNELRRMNGVFENILGIKSERIEHSQNYVNNVDRNNHQFVAEAECNGEKKVIGTMG